MATKVSKINPPAASCPAFKAESDQPLTDSICMDLQTKAGYHPAGYGFYGAKFSKEGETFVAHWSCSASCD